MADYQPPQGSLGSRYPSDVCRYSTVKGKLTRRVCLSIAEGDRTFAAMQAMFRFQEQQVSGRLLCDTRRRQPSADVASSESAREERFPSSAAESGESGSI